MSASIINEKIVKTTVYKPIATLQKLLKLQNKRKMVVTRKIFAPDQKNESQSLAHEEKNKLQQNQCQNENENSNRSILSASSNKSAKENCQNKETGNLLKSNIVKVEQKKLQARNFFKLQPVSSSAQKSNHDKARELIEQNREGLEIFLAALLQKAAQSKKQEIKEEQKVQASLQPVEKKKKKRKKQKEKEKSFEQQDLEKQIQTIKTQLQNLDNLCEQEQLQQLQKMAIQNGIDIDNNSDHKSKKQKKKEKKKRKNHVQSLTQLNITSYFMNQKSQKITQQGSIIVIDDKETEISQKLLQRTQQKIEIGINCQQSQQVQFLQSDLDKTHHNLILRHDIFESDFQQERWNQKSLSNRKMKQSYGHNQNQSKRNVLVPTLSTQLQSISEDENQDQVSAQTLYGIDEYQQKYEQKEKVQDKRYKQSQTIEQENEQNIKDEMRYRTQQEIEEIKEDHLREMTEEHMKDMTQENMREMSLQQLQEIKQALESIVKDKSYELTLKDKNKQSKKYKQKHQSLNKARKRGRPRKIRKVQNDQKGQGKDQSEIAANFDILKESKQNNKNRKSLQNKKQGQQSLQRSRDSLDISKDSVVIDLIQLQGQQQSEQKPMSIIQSHQLSNQSQQNNVNNKVKKMINPGKVKRIKKKNKSKSNITQVDKNDNNITQVNNNNKQKQKESNFSISLKETNTSYKQTNINLKTNITKTSITTTQSSLITHHQSYQQNSSSSFSLSNNHYQSISNTTYNQYRSTSNTINNQYRLPTPSLTSTLNKPTFVSEIRSNSFFYLSSFIKVTFPHQQKTQIVKLKAQPSPHCLNYLQQTLKILKACDNTQIKIPQDHQVVKIKLKRKYDLKDKKILALDLDQTLIHSVQFTSPEQELTKQQQTQIYQKFRHKFPFKIQCQQTKKIQRMYAIRNHAKQFLKSMSHYFYVIIFTSAQKGYADKIIDELDPQGKYIQDRLYRNNCYNCFANTPGATQTLAEQDPSLPSTVIYPYVKDLRVINKPLSEILLVDNSICTYYFQMQNGVPIIPFEGEQDDELRRLERYLIKLSGVHDVRTVNKRMFRTEDYRRCQSPQDIMRIYKEICLELLQQDQQQQVQQTQQSQSSPPSQSINFIVKNPISSNKQKQKIMRQQHREQQSNGKNSNSMGVNNNNRGKNVKISGNTKKSINMNKSNTNNKSKGKKTFFKSCEQQQPQQESFEQQSEQESYIFQDQSYTFIQDNNSKNKREKNLKNNKNNKNVKKTTIKWNQKVANKNSMTANKINKGVDNNQPLVITMGNNAKVKVIDNPNRKVASGMKSGKVASGMKSVNKQTKALINLENKIQQQTENNYNTTQTSKNFLK